MQQHQTSMEVTDVHLDRKLEGYFEDAVVFPCSELKHKLLLSSTVCFSFAPLHCHDWKLKTNSDNKKYTEVIV